MWLLLGLCGPQIDSRKILLLEKIRSKRNENIFLLLTLTSFVSHLCWAQILALKLDADSQATLGLKFSVMPSNLRMHAKGFSSSSFLLKLLKTVMMIDGLMSA